MDAQGELPGVLGAAEPVGGGRVFQKVVWEGDPQPAAADQEGGQESERTSRGLAGLLRTSHYQCGDRSAQRAHRRAQGQRPRLPKLRELPHANPFLSGQTRPAPRRTTLIAIPRYFTKREINA